MSEIGRKSLPHEIPLWVDPSREIYFLTLCAKHRETQPLLPVAPHLLAAIRHAHEQETWWAHVAVVMPDHVHLIARVSERLTAKVRAWKHWTARHLGVDWQRDFFEHRLRREESLRDKADYVLRNPERAGLVRDWRMWPHIWFPDPG